MDERRPFYYRETEGIRVTVRPVYIEDQSMPVLRRYVFVYFIRMIMRSLAMAWSASSRRFNPVVCTSIIASASSNRPTVIWKAAFILSTTTILFLMPPSRASCWWPASQCEVLS